VAAGGADRTILVWLVDQPEAPPVCLEGHTDQVRCVAFVPGGGLPSGSRDGTVRLWDCRKGVAKGAVYPEVGTVAAVAFGAAGGQIAIAGERLRVRQADGAFRQLPGHQGPVACVAFAADGGRLLSGGSDGTVRLWRSADGEELACFGGDGGPVQAVALGPDGRVGYSGGSDGTLRRWHLPA
jgi:WD40 repeat protein